MNKRLILFTMVMVVVLSFSLFAVPASAQSDPLICDQFTSGTTEVRVSYYMGEGMGYFESGNLAAALDSFSCVIDQIDSNYLPAYMSRAAVYTEYRSYDEALADYGKAISLDSSFVAAYNNRGIVYAAQTEYDAALADFDHSKLLSSQCSEHKV
ncbi:MAG TPA: tetratricopeptide repeat protein [Aggregatilineaceae bacterium]|nr:tetratricopeptide repeat protein [Aggregatilineaceae bacterium]